MSTTLEAWRKSDSSSRSKLIASISAWWASLSPGGESGWRRRVSENRRTSASVEASRKMVFIAMPDSRSLPMTGSRCGKERALRTSTAIAMRGVNRECSSETNVSISSGGRLSTQK